ncbi:MAG: hypothetical protein IH859_00710 [Chloroflexi bacterium]|nr:hypothetical protein [Chloroflexota bacterium]
MILHCLPNDSNLGQDILVIATFMSKLIKKGLPPIPFLIIWIAIGLILPFTTPRK